MVANERGVFKSLDTMYGPAGEAGQRQTAFESVSQIIVSEASREIQEVMKDTSKDISELAIPLFYSLIANFGKKRQQLAQMAKTPRKEFFGVRYKDTDGDFYLTTNLHGVYEPANLAALAQLSERIKSIPFNGKKFAETSNKTSEIVLGRHFSCEIQMIDEETMKQKSTVTAQEEGELAELGKEWARKKTIMTQYDWDGQIKKERPKIYEKGRQKSLLNLLEEEYPSPTSPSDTKYLNNRKSHYILATMRMQIGQQMVRTAQWLTWLSQNGEVDPREHMLDAASKPVVSLITQDLFLHDETLKECAKLFVEVLKWDRKASNINELKDRVALFRHLYAHVSPHARGSGAIGEWFEKSLYDAFGLSCSYTPAYPKESVDLVAQGNLKFSDYLRRYHTLVHIQGEQCELAANVTSFGLNDGKTESKN